MYADALREHAITAWVLWDFRGSNPALWELLGVRAPGTSRRAVLVIRADGEPRLLCSVLDRPLLERLEVALDVYADRHELVERLGRFDGRVAMEVSPSDALPAVDFAPAGAVELVRSLGAEVVSSADLFQAVAAAWDAEAEASHHRAVRHVMDLHAFARAHARGSTEAGLSGRLADEIARRGLDAEDVPGVSVGPGSGDPHHAPADVEIGDDAVLLVDLWARERGPRAVYSDVTWMGWTGPAEPPAEALEVFGVVAAARDAALHAAQPGRPAFEADREARRVIEAAGFGDALRHRTGHSLTPGPRVHGLGANLDDTETRDTRTLAPGTAFTVEPGIYLPAFGVRLECDVHLHPERGPMVTTPLQRDLLQPPG